jgi:hypothetical protein
MRLIKISAIFALLFSSAVGFSQPVIMTVPTSGPNTCDGMAYIDSTAILLPTAWFSITPNGTTNLLGQDVYSVQNLCPGNYLMYFTIQGGDTITLNFNIGTGNPNPCANFGAYMTTTSTIDGSCSGTADVMPYGGQSPYNYSWTNNNIGSSLIGLCAGDYYCVVTDANGCVFTANGNVGIINGVPPITVDTFLVIFNNNIPPNTVPFDSLQVQITEDCTIDPDLIGSAEITAMQSTPIGSAITWTVYALDGSVLGTYQFDFNVPLNPGAFYYSTFILYCDGRNNGTYALTVHDYFEYNSTASISSVSNLEIKVVNPLTNELQLTFSEAIQGELKLIDASGRIIFTDQIEGSNYTKKTDNLAPGLYLLSIQIDNKNYEFKLLK